MEIIRASGAHLDEIVEIERESFPDPWSRGSIEQCVQGKFASVLAAVEDGHVEGFAIFNVLADEAELYTIAVRRDSRRRGVGGAILKRVKDCAREQGAVRMFLEVRKSNAAARALYKRVGFAVCGERRGYYDAPREDAVLMDIDLGGFRE